MRAWFSRNRKWALWGIIAAAGLAAVYGLVALYSQPEEAARGRPEEVRRHMLERQRQAEAALEARRQAREEMERRQQAIERLTAQLRDSVARGEALARERQALEQQRQALERRLQAGEMPEQQRQALERRLRKLKQHWQALAQRLAQQQQELERRQQEIKDHRQQWEGNLYGWVYEQVSQLVPGKVVFNPPAEMRVGVKERITVRIARDAFEGDIKANLAGRGAPQVEAVEVGTFMRVRLFGDGFTVTARSDEGQLVPEGRFAEWLFDVWPEASGRRMLELLVTVRVKLPGGEEPVNLPVLRREITVQVNPWWTISQLFAEHWQWFLGGLASAVAAVIGYFGRRWLEDRRSRRASKSGTPPATPGESKPPDTGTPPSGPS